MKNLKLTISSVLSAVILVALFIVFGIGFGVLLLITLNKKPIELITDLKGLNSQHPWFAFLLLIIMLSRKVMIDLRN